MSTAAELRKVGIHPPPLSTNVIDALWDIIVEARALPQENDSLQTELVRLVDEGCLLSHAVIALLEAIKQDYPPLGSK